MTRLFLPKTFLSIKKRSACCSLYFSTNVLCNSFKDRVLTGEACAVVPISECKSRDFFNTSQIFREENSEETLGLPKNIDTSALIINNKWRRKKFTKNLPKRTCRWIPSANIWFYIHAAKFFHTILWLKCWRTCFSNWCMTFYIRGTAFYTDLIGSYHIIPGYEAHRLCWWMTVAKLFWVYDLLPVFY